MLTSHVGTNTLYFELECPYCHKPIRSGIGFRVGAVEQTSYHLGQTLRWQGRKCRPETRPPGGNIKTIGYFNCDNPRCETWGDCFPEVQEALITITKDLINNVEVVTHKPEDHSFDIIEQS